MSAATKIEWTEITWNPTTGCDRISPGCDHCYALRLAGRLKAMGQPKYQRDGDLRTSGPGFGVTVHEDVLLEPLGWRKHRKVFVNSMSDIGHARVPAWLVARVFAVMALSPQHSFHVLTKRPGRLASMLGREEFRSGLVRPRSRPCSPCGQRWRDRCGDREHGPLAWPVPNVWVGTSIESDEYCWRAGELRQVPAATRFLSLEPLLGPLPSLELTSIDWVIVGGESGPGFRPLDLDWVRGIRDRCAGLAMPLFFKQVGGLRPKAGGRLLDGRTWDEFPVTAGTGAVNACWPAALSVWALRACRG
jgi:protein gp37